MAQKLFDVAEIVKQYIRILESEGIHVEKALLYGSYARGSAGPESDVDLVIISRDLAKYDFPRRLSILARATLHVSAPLEVIGYTPNEIAGCEGESIFWDEILSSGQEIYKTA